MDEKIRMIPIAQMRHHPKNPRTDIGDVTELADSIRSQGILQNLTVVPDGESGGYLVLIGNRRFEAAKLAGLTELPCTVAHMDEREQLQTMIAENMQRQDLTVYDQAMGFQMMLDLGCSEDEIAARTGVSRTTVGRRLKMAELDREQLYGVVKAQQLTIRDFERLGQVKSVKERNMILKKAGSNDFDWTLTNTLRRQKTDEVKPDALRFLRGAGFQQIKRDDMYTGKYEDIKRVSLYQWDGSAETLMPKEESGFYFMDEVNLYFYRKAPKKPKAERPKKSQEEIDEEKRIAEAWKQLEEDCETAKVLRASFARGIRVTEKNRDRLVMELICAVILNVNRYETPKSTIYKKFLFLNENYPNTEDIEKALKNISGKDIVALVLTFWEGDKLALPVKYEYRTSMPDFEASWRLQHLYEWLCAEGYHLSKVEQSLIAGTHPSFAKKKEKEGADS